MNRKYKSLDTPLNDLQEKTISYKGSRKYFNKTLQNPTNLEKMKPIYIQGADRTQRK